MQAATRLFFGIAQIQRREQAPDANRQTRQERTLNLAEPAHAARQKYAWHPVGQQEVDVFLKKKLTKKIDFHKTVNKLG
jgi:hypothetical protein